MMTQTQRARFGKAVIEAGEVMRELAGSLQEETEPARLASKSMHLGMLSSAILILTKVLEVENQPEPDRSEPHDGDPPHTSANNGGGTL